MPAQFTRSLVVVTIVGLSLTVGVGRAMARGGGGHGGGGHGGGHHEGAHHGGEHHGEHHAEHHGEHHDGEHHADHHYNHYHHHYHYNHGWNNGWGWGLAGLGLGAAWGGGLGNWGSPVGGWGAYGYADPISVPLDGQYVNNQYAANDGGSDDSSGEMADGNDSQPQTNQLAQSEDEDDDDDFRGAIHLLLPDADTHVFLNGKLVAGTGKKRLLLTPEMEDDQPHKYHVMAVWEIDGRPAQREADVEVAPGGGVALNFAKTADEKAATATTGG